MADRIKTSLSSILGEAQNDDTSGDFPNIRKRGSILGSARFGLFSVLYLISKGTGPVSCTEHFIHHFITTLQLLFFCFNPKGAFAWPQDAYDYVVPLLKVVTFSFVQEAGSEATFLVLLCCSLLIVLSLLAGSWVAYQFSCGGVKQLWLLPPLRLAMRLSTGILYLPILILLLNAFDCDNVASGFVACDSAGYMALVALTAMIALVFVGFSIVAVLLVYDRNVCHSKNVSAKVHGRVQGVALVIRTILPLAFTILNQNQPEFESVFSKLVLAFIVLGSGIAFGGANLFYLPSFRKHINCLELAFASIFAWGGLFLVLTQLINDPNDRGVLYSLLASFPLVFYCGYSLAGRRIRTLAAYTKETDSVFTNEIMLRYRFPFDLENWAEIALPEYKRIADGKWRENGFLCLHVAQLSLKLGDNPILASQYMRKARSMNLALDLRYIVFKHSLEVSANQGGRGAISYIAIDHHFRQAEERIIEALEGIIRFWRSQGRSECSPERLFQHSNKVKRLSESARHHLDKLLELTNGSVRSIRLYAKFLKFILNDKWKAQELLDKANLLQDAESENGNEEDFFDTRRNAVAVLGGTEGNMGDLLQVSDKFCKLFGYTRKQLIGNNLSMLMPSPFAERHNGWLARHLETSKSTVAVSRKVWGLHKLGHVISFNLHFKSGLDENDCLIFTGKVTLSNENGKTYLVMNDDGNLLFASENGWKKLLRKLPNTPGLIGSSVKHLVPELDALNLKAINGRPEPLCIQETSYEIEITRLPYKSRGMDFLLLDFHQMDNFSENGSAVDFSDAESLNAKMPGEAADRRGSEVGSQMSDGNSVGSSSVGGRQRSMYARLEKRVLKRKNRSSGFFRGCVICTLLYICLAVAEYTFVEAGETAYLGSITQEFDSNARTTKILQLTQAVQLYILPEYNASLSAAEVSELKHFVQNSSHSLKEVHAKIEAARPIYFKPAEIFAREKGVRTTIDGFTFSDKSLFVAVQELINNVDLVVERRERGVCGVACNYILRNGAGVIAVSSKEASELYAAQTLYIQQLVELTNIIFAVSYLVLTAMLTVRYLLPFAMKIWFTQENTAIALLNIPKTASSEILKTAQAHLAEIKKETFDLYDELKNRDGKGKHGTGRSSEAHKENSGETREASPAETEGNTKKVEFDGLPGPLRGVNVLKSKIKTRKVAPNDSKVRKKGKTRTFLEILRRTLKLTLPFVVPFAAFELTKEISKEFLPQYVPGEVAFSGERATTASWVLSLTSISGNFTQFNRFYPEQNFSQVDFELIKSVYPMHLSILWSCTRPARRTMRCKGNRSI